MKTNEITFIGGGRITRIILEGWTRSGLSLDHLNLTVAEPDSEVRVGIASHFPGVHTTGDNGEAARAKLVFFAVHPPAISEVLSGVSGKLRSDAIAVSLAPKFTIAKLSELLGGFDRLSRCIPNAPSLVGAGFNPVTHGDALTDADRAIVAEALAPLGEAPEVPEENLEAYAVLTAMGPTYFWFQFQTLRELAGEFGLTAPEADSGLRAMIAGAADTLLNTTLEASEVMDLIPVKPIAGSEDSISQTLRDRLRAIHDKIAPV